MIIYSIILCTLQCFCSSTAPRPSCPAPRTDKVDGGQAERRAGHVGHGVQVFAAVVGEEVGLRRGEGGQPRRLPLVLQHRRRAAVAVHGLGPRGRAQPQHPGGRQKQPHYTEEN